MYLNLIQVAESLGVPEKTIETWISQEGLPATLDHGRWLFERERVAQWAVERGFAARAGFLAPTTPALGTENPLTQMLDRGGIHSHVHPGAVLDCFEAVLARIPGLPASARSFLSGRLRATGGVSLAPVGRGFALPHPSARIALGHDSGVLALLLLDGPYPAPEPRVDETPITRMFFFVAPSARLHIDLLAKLSRLISRGELSAALDRGATEAEIRALIRKGVET